MANLFGTVLSATLGVADSNTYLSIAGGITTIVNCTLTASVALSGITMTGGNIDGMVVTLQNVTGSFTLSANHETGATATSMFRNSGNTTVNGGVGYGGLTWRYNGTLQRWINLGAT